MTSKEYLRQYRTLDLRVNTKLTQIEELRSLAVRLSPTARFDKAGNVTDKVGRTVSRIVDLERELQNDIDELVQTGEKIRRAINSLTDERLKVILELRYIKGNRWDNIAFAMDYDIRQIFRLHGIALRKIKDVIECQY